MNMAKLPKLDIQKFTATNVARCMEWHGAEDFADDPWTLADYANAIAGEAGELSNVVKKMRRLELGLTGNKSEDDGHALVKKARDEIADVFIYLNLLAARLEVDMESAIIDKFNRKSRELGMHFFTGTYSKPTEGQS